MTPALPWIECPRREFCGLTADVNAPLWTDVTPVFLSDAITGAQPRQDTAVRTAWSPREWRVLFHATDADAWATLTERDAPLYEEETVEIFFDPAGDLQSYFEIEVNPLGTVLDLAFRRNRSGCKGDRAWNCEGLETLVRRDAGAWTVELAVPFDAVSNSRPEPETEWRVNFCRIDRPSRDGSIPRELTAWSPPRRANFHTPERFGTLRFGE